MRSWICLLSLVCLVHSQSNFQPVPGDPEYISLLDEELLDQTEYVYGLAVRQQFELCAWQSNFTYCNVLGLLFDVAKAGVPLRTAFDKCLNCPIPASWCDKWRSATLEKTRILEAKCSAMLSWGDGCQQIPSLLEDLAEDPNNDIAVMCNIISPPSFSRTCESSHRFKNSDVLQTEEDQSLPIENTTCGRMVTAMIANTMSLTDCVDTPREQCIDHFCDLYQEFYFRIRPWNVQEKGARPRYSYDYVLPGCEHPIQFKFDRDQCPQRADVQGFCDCLCVKIDEGPFALTRRSAVMLVETNSVEDIDCQQNIDAYLLFGRLGVRSVELHPDCEPELCKMFNERRSQPECKAFDFPPASECNSMGLSRLSALGQPNCPWEKHSGKEGVISCLDGTECVSESLPDSNGAEHMACCPDKGSIGRGRCPANRPIMCDFLCSGETEFCCRGGFLPESPRDMALAYGSGFRFFASMTREQQDAVERLVEGDTTTGAPCVPLLIPPLGIVDALIENGQWVMPTNGWVWSICPTALGTQCNPFSGRCPLWHGDPASVTCDNGQCVCKPGYCAVESLCVPKLLPPASTPAPTAYPSRLPTTTTTTTTSVTANMYPTMRPTLAPTPPPTIKPTSLPTTFPTAPTAVPTVEPTNGPTPTRRRRRRRRATPPPTPAPTERPTFDADRRRRRFRRRRVVTPSPTLPTPAPPPTVAPTAPEEPIPIEAYDRRRRVDITSNECDMRKCTPLLKDYPVYVEPPPNATTTEIPAGVGAGGEKSWLESIISFNVDFDVSLPAVLWTLGFLLPCSIGVLLCVFWRRFVQFQEDYIDPPLKPDDPSLPMEAEMDNLGGYTVIHKPYLMDDPAQKKRNVRRIVVYEFPDKRPLGLELQETLVVRVHPFGAKNGWKEGDLIIEIGGIPVSTFEELWTQIQAKREQLPVAFIVERLGEGAVSAEAAKLAAPPQPPEKKRRRASRSASKVAPSTGILSSAASRAPSLAMSRQTSSPTRSPTRAEGGDVSVPVTRMSTLSVAASESVSRRATRDIPALSPTMSPTASRNEVAQKPNLAATTELLSLREAAAATGNEDAIAALEAFEAAEDDGIYPDRCYLEDGSICIVCRTQILAYGPSVIVDNEVFHEKCFCCASCGFVIDGKYLRNEDGPGYLCTSCRPRCNNCKESVTGRRACVVDGLRFHVECFVCCDCHNQLRAGEFSKVDRGIYQCLICDARDTAKERGTEIPDWAKEGADPLDKFGAANPMTLYGAGQMSWQSRPASAMSLPTTAGSASRPGSPIIRTEVKKSEPAWMKRMQQKPRIDQAFPPMQKLKDLVSTGNKMKKAKEPEVRFVKDAWGREVCQRNPGA